MTSILIAEGLRILAAAGGAIADQKMSDTSNTRQFAQDKISAWHRWLRENGSDLLRLCRDQEVQLTKAKPHD